jgi:hypothetical protein
LLRADGIKGNLGFAVHDEQGRLLPEGDQPTRYVVCVKDRTVGIAENGERIRVRLQVLGDFGVGVGSDRNDVGSGFGELGMSLTQLRKVLAAKRSEEPSKEDEHNWAVGDGI